MNIDCMTKPTNAIVISHEREATKRLFSAVRSFIENLEYKPAVSIDSKSEMKFPETFSNFFIGTAGSKAVGRGDTIDRAHLSEGAFYDNLDTILAGVSEACEYGQIDIESTPNGPGPFKDLWRKAVKGLSPYTPIFIPWFIDDEYSTDNMTEDEKNGLSDAVVEMFNEDEKDFAYTDEEELLIKKVKAEYDISLSIGQIKWRRYKIWDKGALFFQEYPEDDVSCFLESGRSVFSEIIVDPTLQLDLTDAKIIELIGRNERLFAGLDGAEGKEGGDANAFAVMRLNRETGKATVVFEITSNEPIDVFCAKVEKVCKAFTIRLGVEKNGVGLAHIRELRSRGVRVVEWNTTGTSRPVMISELEQGYRKGEVIESYPEAEREARDMIYDSKNKAVHENNKHDDRVFARAIALQMIKRPKQKATLE